MNMLRTFLLSLLMTCALAAGSTAAEIKEIELIDGSVITGEVLSLSSGVYTIRTGSLGTLTIDDTKVRAIHPRSSSSPSLQAGDVKTLQDKMLSNAEVMDLITKLKEDPQFKNALEDPEIQNAASSGDIASLIANSRFLELLHNPTVQDIQHKVAK
jgi:hypothetical protein